MGRESVSSILFCFFLLFLLCAFINLLQFGFQWNIPFYSPVFVLVGWLFLMVNLEDCSWLWPHLATLGLILPTKLHLISCTHWQMHPLNEVPASPESLLGLLGEIHGMNSLKHYQENRKSLNINTPFTVPILANILSKTESQKEWKKEFFTSPESIPPWRWREEDTLQLIPPQHFVKLVCLAGLLLSAAFPQPFLYSKAIPGTALCTSVQVKILYNSYVSTAAHSHSVDKDVLKASWIHSAVRNWGVNSTGTWIYCLHSFLGMKHFSLI